jgi:class 3 adenylate cyclase/DNA-binding SARP family transcriptional activator/pimeloyl-ACP methyl ester carboxylesterase
VLTLLGLHVGEVVRADVLVELLWGESPPRTAPKALQTHVSALRRALGDSVVKTKAGGWILAGADTDVTRYLAEGLAGRAAASSSDATAALSHYDAALALWRGPPQLPDTPRGAAETTRWEEAHAALVEDRADALLAAGHAAEAVAELEAAVAVAPLRERRWGQLMTALYRTGRQGEALRAYQRARTTLGEELGVEPGTELRRLESAMVAHDASLDAPEPIPVVPPARAVAFLPSVQAPETRFTDSDGSAIAWCEWGSGPDVLVVPPLLSNVELQWEHEIYRRYLERIGRHVRIVAFDKRGIGLSDRFTDTPTLEQRTRDILAVMDAACLERPALLGVSEGGLMAQLFTVLHPERVERLALANSFAGASMFIAAHTAPDGSFDALQEKLAGFGKLVETWGRDPQFFVDWFAPSQSGNESFVRWTGRFQRLSATAADLERQISSLAGLDGSERLGEIAAPTLVAHGVRDAVVPVAVGHALAAAIPGATLAEFDMGDHFLVSSEHWAPEQDVFLEFLTGSRPPRRVERQFATVVFTDIVGSTARGMSAGDEGWCDLLDSHDRIAWETADRHLGTIVKSTGDGLLARFASPSQAVDFCTALRGALIGIGLRIRCGVHTGEIELRQSGDIAGTAVNLAARVEEAAGDGEVFVSSTVRDILLGGETRFEDRGEHALKGFDGSWRVYALVTT